MYIIATFEHSVYLELALSTLECQGIAREDILAAPLKQAQRQIHILDTIHRSDGTSQLDWAFLSSAFAATLGVVYGYILPGGPLLLGLLGLVTGGAVALFAQYSLAKRRGRKIAGQPVEVVIIVKCAAAQAAMIETTLIDHLALGVARVA